MQSRIYNIRENNWENKITRQVCNLFQEPVEQPPLGFSIAEEKSDSLKNQTG